MGKYLNGDGLSHLMTKIKAAIAATVTGIKGNAESSYRTGQVNLTPADVGAVAKSGDTMTGNLVVPATRIANTYYGVSFGRTTGTPIETILYTGIKWRNGSHMPVVHVTGYAYGLQSPVEFKIGFYFYSDKVGWCGATNMGSWNPVIKLFKHTVNNVDYVAVGFSGSCYFLQLQVDVQDEMGKFAYIDLTSSLWSWSFLTTAGTIPAADGGTTCIEVPYKADILAPPVNNATGTLAVAHGGTGQTTLAAARDAMGLGNTTGALPVANGGTGATTAADARVNLGLGEIGYYDGYIRTQPENSLPVIIPFINNDIAFLLKRGGSAVVTYDGEVKNVDISNAFDGSPSYWGITYTGTTEIVIELTLHRVFSWTNYLYIDFGPWWTKTVKVEVMRSDATYPNDVWTEKFNTTTNAHGFIVANVTHTPVGASNSGGGFNKVRLTFSFANGAYSSTMFRIAQIGVVNYSSAGVRETYMSRGIDDYLLRNVTPAATNAYSLGSSSLRWANVYAENLIGNKLKLGNNTTSSIDNAGIAVNDVRNVAITNNAIEMAANFYFSNNAMPTNSWWSLLHVKGWTGGYSAWELAGPAANADQRTTPLYVRTGNASLSNAWGDWRQIFDSAATIPIANGGTGATTADAAWTALGGGAIGKKASLAASDIPAHASTTTTYGAASTSNYGHAKLSSATDSDSEALAATPKAVKAAYDLADTAGNPNLTPYYSRTLGDVYGESTPDGYWYDAVAAGAELNAVEIGDGWAHIDIDNTSGSSGQYAYQYVMKQDFVKPSATYTILAEIANVESGSEAKFHIRRNGSSGFREQICGSSSYIVDVTGDAEIRKALESVSEPSGQDMLTRTYIVVAAGKKFVGDLRLSLYEGDYQGPYKPYVGDYGLLEDSVGKIDAPYTEVEWAESDGTQFVYTDWHPPIATWGVEADFIVRNAFNTTQAAWRSDTNANNAGAIFGTRNASGVNDIALDTYGTDGTFRIGSSANIVTSATFKKDETRQTIKLIGTTLTHATGETSTVTRATETDAKPYANMTIFAFHDGKRAAATGTVAYPGTVRVYSLKFYDGETLVMDLVGAIRNRDGMTGLYDKVEGHFYPAPRMTVGDVVGTLGEPDTVVKALAKQNLSVHIDNRAVSRMWKAEVPELDRLEDGQKLTVTFTTNVGGTTPNAVAAAGIENFAGQWTETTTTSYSSVYLKLVLADGSETEWIPCFYAQGTRLTSHYGSSMPVVLTYRENVHHSETTTSAGTAIMRAWYADPNYDDGNDRNNTIGYFAGKTGAVGIWAGGMFMEDGNDTYQSICTASNGTATSSNRTTATTKKANTHGFKVGSNVYYSATSYNANANISGQNAVASMLGSLFDSRYSFNTSLTAGSLTAYKPVYLVGTVSASDGLYYLDTVWWTQTPNTVGKVYVLVGGCYDSTTSNCRITLYEDNPWFAFDGTRLVPYYKNAVDAAYSLASTANGTANSALSAATGGIVFKITYSVSEGNVVCAAHVYSAGEEVTDDHADSCFVWSTSLNGGTSWTSLGTGKTKTVSALSAYGGNVKCDFTPAS